jgi:hypothetical protein
MIILCEKKYSNKSDNFLEILLKESYKDKLFIHIYIQVHVPPKVQCKRFRSS